MFTGGENRARVNIQITVDKLEDLEEIIRMGFREGFTASLENLNHLLSTQSQPGR